MPQVINYSAGIEKKVQEEKCAEAGQGSIRSCQQCVFAVLIK